MAENIDKLYSAENLGSGTFNISKPKRKPKKLRQSRVKEAPPPGAQVSPPGRNGPGRPPASAPLPPLPPR